MTSILGVKHAAVSIAVPPDACDCHVHVFGPEAQFPYAADRKYTPGPASVEELLALHAALGIGRVVVVHPSCYGTDNACTVDAVRRMGARARGVAVIDERTSDQSLADMHAAGIRGVRVNLETIGAHDPVAACDAIFAAAARVGRLGWHVQVFTNLAVIEAMHDAMMSLEVPLVVDHFGRADAAKGVSQPGFGALLSLVRNGKAYVKLSATYRVSALADSADAAPLARALIAANVDRMLWGSDWPHPGGPPGGERRRDVIEPFRPIDDGAALNRLASWTSDADQLRKILVDNPARLYDF